MKSPTPRLGAALLLGLALVAMSCSNDYGIYASIQKETYSDTSSIFLQTPVIGLVVYNNSYYARLSSIYSRTVAAGVGEGWALTSISAAGIDSTYVCNGLVALSDGLYAALSAGYVTSSPQGIYKYDGSTWTRVLASTVSIQDLYAVNGKLFASVRVSESDSGSTYTLYYFDGTSLVSTGMAGVSSLPVGGTYFNSEYWFASGTSLYHGSSPTAISSSYTMSKSLTALTTDGTVMYAGTSDGSVCTVNASGTQGSLISATSDTDYWVTSLLCVPVGSKTYLLAGNGYRGYYEADATDHNPTSFVLGDASTAVVASTTNFDTSVRYLPVYGFTYDSANRRLFVYASSTMSTSYGALWSNLYDGSSSWGGWAAE